MGHLINNKEEVYRALAERLNKNPVGAPINEFLMEILHRLYTESEALVGSKFPLVPMSFDHISDIVGVKKVELRQILESMANKGLVLDVSRREGIFYMLAPMVVGFFEYTFMRVREEINMAELAELFEKYFSSDGVIEEFCGSNTKMMQTIVYEKLIPAAVETEVLSYERASEVLRESGGGAISMCACRHKASHLGKDCYAPMEVCMSLGNASQWAVKRGLGKAATVDDLLRVLELTENHGLVHTCDNVLKKPAFICHCCSCCCMLMRSINEKGVMSVHPSNFMPQLEEELCSECGTCTESCHVKAINMVAVEGEAERPTVQKELCIGCGVCANACPTGALTMSRRSVLHVPPANKKEQFMQIAKEKGRL